MGAGIFIGIAILAIFLIWSGVAVYTNWQVGLAYQRDVGGFYEYADRSSDAVTKSMYFDKYINAIKENGLTSGYNSVFFQNQPTANLANDWNVALSLQKRLDDLAKTDPNTMQYHLAMQEISNTEMCWFPVDAFEQGYDIKNGAWGMSLTPAQASNQCVSSHSSS